MFKCVNCGYEGSKFNAGVAGISEGAFTYFAKCPKCGSSMVKHLPGYFESNLQIGIRPLTIKEQLTTLISA